MFKGESIRETELNYTIDTELSIGNLGFLPEYLRRHYLLEHGKYRTFKNVRVITEDAKLSLFYRVSIPKTNHYADVTVDAGIPINVTMKLSDPNIPKSFLDQPYLQVYQEREMTRMLEAYS